MIVLPGIIVGLFVAGYVLLRQRHYPQEGLDRLLTVLEDDRGPRQEAALELRFHLLQLADKHETVSPAHVDRILKIAEHELNAAEAGNRERILTAAYLCRALGALGPEATAALTDASRLHRGTPEATSFSAVRAAASASLAELLSRQPNLAADPPQSLVSAVIDAASDPDSQVRSVAAFALGLIDGASAKDTLGRLLDDDDRLVRYNAAAALARRGDRRAVPVLCEMLTDPLEPTASPRTQIFAAQPPEAPRDSPALQRLVTANALRAVELLLAAQQAEAGSDNSDSPEITAADRENLRRALENAAARADTATADRVRELLDRLHGRP
ncbi:hypothetical protein JCM19992_28870 [Thermostilla marina]